MSIVDEIIARAADGDERKAEACRAVVAELCDYIAARFDLDAQIAKDDSSSTLRYCARFVKEIPIAPPEPTVAPEPHAPVGTRVEILSFDRHHGEYGDVIEVGHGIRLVRTDGGARTWLSEHEFSVVPPAPSRNDTDGGDR